MSGTAKANILVVDDEDQMRRLLSITLREAGYRVREAETGRTALGEIALRSPDVIILDLGLPDVSGMDVLRAMRPLCAAPVLILSVFAEESGKIAALDGGANDFLTKPFGSGELLARLRVLLRRAEPASPDMIFRFGKIEVDFFLNRVFRDGQPVQLTAKENALLHFLIAHRDRLLTHGEILRQLWGPEAENQTNYLRVYMKRLRDKLGDDVDTEGGHFQTEAGIGYRFVGELDVPRDS